MNEVVAVLDKELAHLGPVSIKELKDLLDATPGGECSTEHHFAPGLYVREFRMGKGTVVLGCKHKEEHMLLLTEGHVRIWTEEGSEYIKAPHMSKSWKGCQRVLYALEDSVLLSFHPTTTTDLDELRKELIED